MAAHPGFWRNISALLSHGIDLSDDFIDTAHLLNQWCGVAKDGTITLKQGSLLALPYPDGLFDAVLCQHVLLNIEDKPKAFAEFSRVLAPGGKLILHEIVARTRVGTALPCSLGR